jgi:hypothetical protein
MIAKPSKQRKYAIQDWPRNNHVERGRYIAEFSDDIGLVIREYVANGLAQEFVSAILYAHAKFLARRGID